MGVGAHAKGLSQISSFFSFYQKYLDTSVRVGCTPLIWERAQIQRIKESRLTIRGNKNSDPSVASVEIWIRPVIYSQRLVSLSVTLQEKAVKGPSMIPIVNSMFAGSRRRRCFAIFEPNDRTFHRRRSSE